MLAAIYESIWVLSKISIAHFLQLILFMVTCKLETMPADTCPLQFNAVHFAILTHFKIKLCKCICNYKCLKNVHNACVFYNACTFTNVFFLISSVSFSSFLCPPQHDRSYSFYCAATFCCGKLSSVDRRSNNRFQSESPLVSLI